jgi:hypothetical protein
MGTAAERADTAARLREEAELLLVGSGLDDMFHGRFGEVARAGGLGDDLMVRRDIDLTVPIDPERTLEWAGMAADVAATVDANGLALTRALFVNEYIDPHPPGPGLFWSFELRDPAGPVWTVNVWGFEPFDFAVRQAREANFRADLGALDRDLVLALKTEALADPRIGGHLVCRFLLARGGATLPELLAWAGLE